VIENLWNALMLSEDPTPTLSPADKICDSKEIEPKKSFLNKHADKK
jgi:hypothetical protein